MQSQTRIFTRLVGEFATPPPVVLGKDATVAESIARLAEAKQSSALVVDDDGQPAGILTEQERIVLNRIDPMAETVFLMIAADGKIAVPRASQTARGRVRAFHRSRAATNSIIMRFHFAIPFDPSKVFH